MRSPFARVVAPSVLALSLLCGGGFAAQAQQVRIPLPKKSKYTPVQQLNRDGVAALNKHDLSKAKRLFYKAYLIDPNDPFTLNNLGYTMEGQGDLQAALRYYNDASITHSNQAVVVAIDPRWRGKSISDIAFRNEQSVRERLASQQSNQDLAARLNVQGVSALNHNEPNKALNYFEQAYKLDPQSAFSLNNMGFLSEARGDQETAAEFYSLAQRGDQAGTPVNVASHHEMVGEPVAEVAGANAQGSEANLQAEAERKRRSHAPIVLRRRDNTPVSSPGNQPQQAPSSNVPRPPVDNAPVENTVPRPPQR